MKHVIIIVLTVLVFSCKEKINKNTLKNGIYRAELKVNDTLNLPFNFEVVSEHKIKIRNAEEVIEVNDITYKGDSVYIQTPVFEGFIVAKIKDSVLIGSFKKPELNRIMPLRLKKMILDLMLVTIFQNMIFQEIGKQYLVLILKKTHTSLKVFLNSTTIRLRVLLEQPLAIIDF